MTLYSYNTRFPEPLPFRITLPNGFTRTDPSTFTAEEITAAGYVGPIPVPAYDPATEHLTWDGTSLSVEPLPPPVPTPEWVGFASDVMGDAGINQMLAGLIAAAPGLYGGLVVGLQQASSGDSRVFLNAWNGARAQNLITPEVLTIVVDYADARNLPAEFLADLVS